MSRCFSRGTRDMNKSLVGYGRLAMLVEQAEKGVPSLLKAVMIKQARGITFILISRDDFYSLVRRTTFSGVLFVSPVPSFNKIPSSRSN